jgi:hypothetical protein
MKNITFVALVSNKYRHVYDTNLATSPPLMNIYNNELIVINEFSLQYACVSLNTAIETSRNDIIVFVQADVYLPIYWDIKLHEIIHNIEETNLNWGILGIFGVSKNKEFVGHVYSNGLQKELGKHNPPIEAMAIDETLFVLNKRTGIRFDDDFPYLYLYGNDLLIKASDLGYKSYIISNFLVHNSVTAIRYQKNGLKSVEYFRRKWPNKLPFLTPYLIVYQYKYLNYYYKIKQDLLSYIRNNKKTIKVRHNNPSSIHPR